MTEIVLNLLYPSNLNLNFTLLLYPLYISFSKIQFSAYLHIIILIFLINAFTIFLVALNIYGELISKYAVILLN